MHADQSLRSTPLSSRLPIIVPPVAGEGNWIVDCSASDRFGLRGPGTWQWLGRQSLAVPDDINAALSLDCGTIVVRLGGEEVLILDDPLAPTKTTSVFEKLWLEDISTSRKGYNAYRDECWAWFHLSGPAVHDAMQRLTAIDTRPDRFDRLAVAQTRCAHLDAVLLRSDRFGAPGFDVFVDIASSDFAFDVIADAFEGAQRGRLTQILSDGSI